VELAIVLPVLLLLVFGSVDAVQIAMANYTVNAAARLAANQAALIGGPDGNTGAAPLALPTASGTVAQAVRAALDGGMATRSTHAGATLTVTCATSPCQRYQPITVTVVYADAVWAPIGPFRSFAARATATRSSEQDRMTTPGLCGLVGAPPCP
jgi:Flp pilus assembly protein TadG